MVPFTRIVTILMATVMVCVLLVPLALSRHDVRLATLFVAIYVLYLAFNAYVFVRTRTRRP